MRDALRSRSRVGLKLRELSLCLELEPQVRPLRFGLKLREPFVRVELLERERRSPLPEEPRLRSGLELGDSSLPDSEKLSEPPRGFWLAVSKWTVRSGFPPVSSTKNSLLLSTFHEQFKISPVSA